MARFFAPDANGVRVAPALRSVVRFERRNLPDPFTDLGSFDVIFCRNVPFYFDAKTKGRVLDRLADALAPGGLLFLGATETPLGLTTRLRRSTRTSSSSYESDRVQTAVWNDRREMAREPRG